MPGRSGGRRVHWAAPFRESLKVLVKSHFRFTFKTERAYCAVCVSRCHVDFKQALRSILWMAAVLAMVLPFSAPASQKTQIHLLLSVDAARPGDTIWAGLEMDMPAPWHTYWRNGGDAGDPTRIDWQLPRGISAGEINWPIPSKLSEPAGDTPLVTYIYTNKVVLLIPLTLARDMHPGTVELKANTHWMECSDICVMASNDVTATLVIADEAKPSTNAALIEEWRRKNSFSCVRWRSCGVLGKSRFSEQFAPGKRHRMEGKYGPCRFLSVWQYEFRCAGDDGDACQRA